MTTPQEAQGTHYAKYQRKKRRRPLGSSEVIVIDSDPPNAPAAPTPSAANTTGLRCDIERLKRELDDVRQELAQVTKALSERNASLHNANSQCKYYKQKYHDIRAAEPGASIADKQGLAHALEAVVLGWKISRHVSSANYAAMIAQAIFSDDFLDGATMLPTIHLVRKYYHDNVFTPMAILREMDVAGTELNLQGLELLRRVEKNKMGIGTNKRNFFGILPSMSSISLISARIEQYANPRMPYEIMVTPFGEAARFTNIPSLIELLFKGHGIDELARTASIQLATSVDAAPIGKTLSLLTLGIVMNDQRSLHPVSKLPLCVEGGEASSLQSRTLCYPVYFQLARETKESMKLFGPTYELFENITADAKLVNENYVNIQMAHKADMSASWKLTGKGGAAKVKTNFCMCCPIDSKFIHVPALVPCQRCKSKQLNDPSWPCHHFDFIGGEDVTKSEEKANAIIASLGASYATGMEQQKNPWAIKLPDERLAIQNGTTDQYCILYQPMPGSEERNRFATAVSEELLARGLVPVIGGMEARRDQLKERLIVERDVAMLLHKVEVCKRSKDAFVDICNMVPCILHLEIRCGIKVLDMVFARGLNACLTKKDQEVLILAIEKAANEIILGTSAAPSQWKMPVELVSNADGTKTYVTGDLRLNNPQVRKFMQSFNVIASICIDESSILRQHINALAHYKESMQLLRKRSDYTNQEIEAYQDHVDNFFVTWVALYGKDGCTNYIHSISSGHIAHYMKMYRCLYRYSQQGWEAWNALLTSFYFRRTQRGGHVQVDKPHTKLVPLMRWQQRRVMWSLGLTIEMLEEHETLRRYGGHHLEEASDENSWTNDDLYD